MKKTTCLPVDSICEIVFASPCSKSAVFEVAVASPIGSRIQLAASNSPDSSAATLSPLK